MPLSDDDRAILAFEESWWTRSAAKGAAIRAELGMTPSTYYRRLAALTDLPAAADHAPLVVRRLRRRRFEQRRERFAGPSARRRRS